ncbi:Dolichol-phosphate mannosyltransferase in lipid-linked oligosaccharide synthesis cluster [Dickeya aquatica]|uniref:Dolichol-phosphate mannosyltransferase in lipid-linked oligosaccharide synthesis cluster n=2 Tax=Pectobacteriaceae TaxID=1903410 RepID=A0A375A9D3_9GAMM|nr:Dolichol-phosphate mannosyltransferase in lipid-linked oligosaccharide synthesis cluster [Dickeya aquatica]
MIIKNEARHLARTLASLMPYFDDIVIVDTGSDDGSQAIARQYTHSVHDFTWVNDFSAARNASLTYARHDWVLVVDADEEIESIDIEALYALIKQHPKAIGRVERINYIDDESGQSTIRECINRLFHKNLYHYTGIIHEQVTPRKNHTQIQSFTTPITLNHVGYKKEILQQTDKITRNITLLKQALETEPEDPYLLFQLGKSYYLKRDYTAAIQAFQHALRFETNFSYEYMEDLVETYGYALINQGSYAEAMNILDYESYFSSTDFTFLKALILMNNGQLQLAVNTFLLCTSSPPGNKEGVNSYKANYNIGVIFECAGMQSQALEFYQKCGDYPPARDGIKRVTH